jgi:Chaperone of endosialidase
MLVSVGFARIYGTRTPLPNGRDSRSYLAHLHELENEAKAAKRGAWGKEQRPWQKAENGLTCQRELMRRFKKEIKRMEQTSEAILSLRPVMFHYKNDNNIFRGKRRSRTCQIKKFSSSCEQDNVFRRSTAGNYMLKMWQADQGDC